MKATLSLLSTAVLVLFTMAAAAIDGPPVEQRIVSAIGLLDGTASAFTKGGVPRVRAIEKLIGDDITAAQRDAGWAAYSAGPQCPECVAPIVDRSVPHEDMRTQLDAITAALTREALKGQQLNEQLETSHDATAAQRVRAERAEGQIANARTTARLAQRKANRAVSEATVREAAARDLARAAEAKTSAVLAGESVCRSERRGLAGKVDEWFADGWREAAGELLRCLSIGE